MQVVINGILTRYEVAGTGRAVVLLHGWGDSLTTFQALAKELSPTYQVIVLDLPGFGQSQAPPEAWGLTEYAQFVSDFLKKIDIHSYAVVGHSNGGAIALRGLAQGTLQADKLVLLASSGIRGTYKGRALALRLVVKFGKLLASPLPARVKHRLRRKVYQTAGSDMLVAEHLQDTFKRIVTDDVRADAANLQLPTLLIYGSQDTATPVKFGQQLSEKIKGSRLEIVPDAGHFVHHDGAAQVTTLVKDFLK